MGTRLAEHTHTRASAVSTPARMSSGSTANQAASTRITSALLAARLHTRASPSEATAPTVSLRPDALRSGSACHPRAVPAEVGRQSSRPLSAPPLSPLPPSPFARAPPRRPSAATSWHRLTAPWPPLRSTLRGWRQAATASALDCALCCRRRRRPDPCSIVCTCPTVLSGQDNPMILTPQEGEFSVRLRSNSRNSRLGYR
jgi:hypothetical protein